MREILTAAAVGLLLAAATPAVLAAQECGHCHEKFDEIFEEWWHQMTEDEPDFACCQAEGGHIVHDCENGDGEVWGGGQCDTHEIPCSGCPVTEQLLALAVSTPVSRVEAEQLAARFPLVINYSSALPWMLVKDCSGRPLAVREVRTDLAEVLRPAAFFSRKAWPVVHGGDRSPIAFSP